MSSPLLLRTEAHEEEMPAAGADSEELEPLFDYSRVQPTIDFCFDDSDLEESDIFVHCNKRPKVPAAAADDANAVEGGNANEKGDAGIKKATVVNLDDEDWLAPPPLKPVLSTEVCKDKTMQELRLKKQEVEKQADDAFQKVVENVKKDMLAKKPPEPIVLDEPTEIETKKSKEKICIMIQEKDGRQQFRVSKDEKFDKLFKAYAKKVQLSSSDLTFVFDGDKINPASTPQDLDLEDEDMIEVHHKPTLDKPAEACVKKSREKILIMIQDEDVKLQFRIYKDEKLDKLFKVYAKKVQQSPSDLIFIFDGDKINSATTPQDLDLENDDMIEVRHKSR
ncbi:NFATC2-interacting protein isoform X1 [Triticum aestivum]|nr:NFATC2-interacting protein-like isoform X1 [Triticum aestivum]